MKKSATSVSFCFRRGPRSGTSASCAPFSESEYRDFPPLRKKRRSNPARVATEATTRFADAFRGLNDFPGKISLWLDNHFFGAAAAAYDMPAKPPVNELTTLLYFVRGAAVLGRRTGFIPGRTASLAGAVLALTEGYRLEIADLFKCAYNLPKTAWAPFVKFSGGSRLDNEFLVAIDPGLELELRTQHEKSGRA